jgi:hypothetical protein
MNEKNEPLAGANIIITNGASKQAISDVEGKFYFTFEAGKNIHWLFQGLGMQQKKLVKWKRC